MSLFRSIAQRAGNPENPSTRLTGSVLLDIFKKQLTTEAGIAVTPLSAARLTAVYRSWSLIAGTTAALPLKAYKKGPEREETTDRHRVLAQPHPDMTAFEFWELAVTHLMANGNFFAEKRLDGNRKIAEMWPFMPGRVRVGRVNGVKTFFVQNDAGLEIPLTAENVFHIPGLGYDGLIGLSPIAMAREAIAAGLSAEKYANKLWASGALMGGILHTDSRLEPEEAEELKRRWNEKVSGIDQAHEVAILDAGAKFQQLTIPPQDAQFLETRKFQVTEIARLYGIPPHLLGEVDRSTSWGTGIELQTLGLIIYTLTPGFLKRIESRVTKEMLPPGEFAEYAVQGLLRGDNKSRAVFYQIMTAMKAMTIEEVRALENMPPLPEDEVDDDDDDVDIPAVDEDDEAATVADVVRLIRRREARA